ncbi:MAG: pilus assembly PilX N-terminal domain-containing protein [Gammaproteobacteria bacterium]|nr:pilus assembly PilX N-terminal domain-containing protein [Gammaproteobacteria bacterium]
MKVTNRTVQRKMLTAPKNQAGLVLVMSLVMLTVLTLIGVSTMSRSTLEMKVASNMQQHNVAFQAAQSRLAFAGSDDASNPINYLIPVPDTPPYPVQTCNLADGCVDGADWKAVATVNYTDCGKGLGSSLESGKGFSYRTFEIRAIGEALKGSSRSVQTSAIRYPVKGCGDDI